MKLLNIERNDGILRIELNSPPLNILGMALLSELTEAFGRAEPADRLVMLIGAGKHFSAGADVGEHLPGQGEQMLAGLNSCFGALDALSVPTLAVVRGACMGAGLELAAACDMVLVSERAKLAVPEISLGVIPPIAAIDLPALVGPMRAAELIYSGRTVDGAEAARIGLALEAVPDDQLEERAAQLAGSIARHSATALRAAKGAIVAAGGRSYADALGAVLALYEGQVLHSADGVEGLNAFIEKREPVWSHG